jgi:hypothetical protein
LLSLLSIRYTSAIDSNGLSIYWIDLKVKTMELEVVLEILIIIWFTAFLSTLFFTIAALKYLSLLYRIPPQVSREFVGQLGIVARINIQILSGSRDMIRRAEIVFYGAVACILVCLPVFMWLTILVNRRVMLLALVTIEIIAAVGWSYSIIRPYWLMGKHHQSTNDAKP